MNKDPLAVEVDKVDFIWCFNPAVVYFDQIQGAVHTQKLVEITQNIGHRVTESQRDRGTERQTPKGTQYTGG